VAGAGGGQWTLSSGGDGRPTWHVGLPAGGDAVVRIAAPRLAAACAAARPAGALEAAVIEGATAADRRLAADLLTAAIVAVPRDAAGDRLPGGRAVAAVN
jgi:hypothetical protein